MHKAISVITLVLIVIVLICLLILLVIQAKQVKDDPPVINRFSIARSRKSVVDTAFPEILLKYDLTSSDTTGIFPTWDTDNVVLGSMCTEIWSGLKYALNHPKEKNAEIAISIAENFMIRYLARLVIIGVRPLAIPWGTNWYEFSVTSTVMLAQMLLF